MIIHTGQLPNPAPMLLVDLVSRTGSPTTRSLSPYDGMRDVLFSQFRKRGVEVDLDKIISMVKSVPDYDADKQQPVGGTWRKDRGHPDHYLRKLEEIDESWVRKYLENVLFGIRKNRSGGLREYAAQNQESRVLIGNEGEETEEGELLIDYGEFAPMDIAEAKSKLPYLLKRLHDKSIAMKVSAMSLIIAYERAKLSRKVPKPMDLLAVGVYRMGKDGNIEGRFPPSANSGKVFPPACDWILGYTQDSYFTDAIELLRICTVLGIDIREEDPFDYQAADIAKLKVTYISKNRDYLSGSRQRNLSVLNSLSSVKISDYAVVSKSATPISVRVMNTVQSVLDCNDASIQKILEQKPDRDALNRFFRAYSEVAKDFRVTAQQRAEMSSTRRKITLANPKALLIPTMDDFITRDGFLYSPANSGVPQLFRIKKFTNDDIRADIAIAHSSGYLFLVADGNCVYYLDACQLTRYVDDFLSGRAGQCTGNQKYGRWNVCFV